MKSAVVLLACVGVLASCRNADQADVSAASSAAKEQPAAEAPVTEWKPESFNEASGHTFPVDQMQFLALMKNADAKFQKLDFETTAEHEARTKDLASLLAPIDPRAEYVFAPQYNDMKYDADSQRYKGEYPTDCYELFFSDGQVACEIAEFAQDVRSYQGQNSYGARAEVTETLGSKIHLVMSKTDARRYRKNSEYLLPNTCPLPIEEAKSIGADGIGFAYLFKVAKAEVEVGDREYEDATIASPSSRVFERHGIWARITGLVCYRRSDSKIVGVERFE